MCYILLLRVPICLIAFQGHQLIDFGTNRKCVCVFLVVCGKQQLGPYLAPFQRYNGLNVENQQFSLPHSYSM